MSMRRRISSLHLRNFSCVFGVGRAWSLGMNVQMYVSTACGSSWPTSSCFTPWQQWGSVTLMGLPSRSCTCTKAPTNCRMTSFSSLLRRVPWKTGIAEMQLLLPRLKVTTALRSCFGMAMASGGWPRKRQEWAPCGLQGACGSRGIGGMGRHAVFGWQLLPLPPLLPAGGVPLRFSSSESALGLLGGEARSAPARRRQQRQKPRSW
mmetsp:Transcript_56231/g.180514  ORF Transcript_56231/g.180514 Transcript_56231/m.180514 type:complete len:206 (+) Transcript_56231:221-838(+)